MKLKERIRTWILVSFGAIVAGTGIYYAFFSMMLLGLIGTATALNQFRKNNMQVFKNIFRNGALYAGSLIIVLVFSMISSWLYIMKNGDPKTMTRDPNDTLVFALETENIFVPPTDHWFSPYREIKPFFYSPEHLAADHVIGAYGGYMGLPAIFGLLIAVYSIFLFLNRKTTRQEQWLALLGIAGVLCIAWGQRYGLGYLFSLYVSAQIRSLYRICIFISTAGLLAFYIWISPRIERIRNLNLKWAACLGLLAISLLDQGGLFFPLNPDHKTIQSDRKFAQDLFAALGDKPLLKLPFGAFPEWSGYMSVEPYSPFRYLMAAPLHSTFPSIKGTKNLNEQWPLFFGQIPRRDLLLNYGIAGIVIDKDDYADRGQAAEATYTGPNTKKFFSPNGRFLFIDLRD